MRSSPLLLLLVAASSATAAVPTPADPVLEGREVEVFDRRAGRTLLGAHAPLHPDSSPEALPHDLFELSPEGGLRLVAGEVAVAAYAPDGAILFVQGDGLFEHEGDGSTRLVARPVLGDFAIDPLGRSIAVARPDAEPDAWLELIDREGRHLAILTEPNGPNAWPHFTPDGSAVFFISGRTGVYAWFGVRSDGSGLTQITNVGLRPGPDVLGPRFVPPPVLRTSIRFLDESVVEYEAGDGHWRLDLASGEAWPTSGVRP